MHYLSFDEVISRIKQLGMDALVAKLDLENAFKYIPVRRADWELLGYTFDMYNAATGTHQKQYFFDIVLQFGGRSSPKLFNDFADASQYIMIKNGATWVAHYLDDYITAGPPGSVTCQRNLSIMQETCHELGFALNPSKLVQPTTCLEFLGIVIDTHTCELRISDQRLKETMEELQRWYKRDSATKREMLSLVGKLIFISRVVKAGRTFVRRMLDQAKEIAHLHYKVKLSHAFKQDVVWWLHYLPTWNGKSMFYDEVWTSSVDLHLYTDASDLAVSGYFQGSWFVIPFTGRLSDLKAHSINWRELYAIVAAAATFGSAWSNKRIMLHCDNQCIVEVVRSGTCKNPQIMDLVRLLFFISATYRFEVSSCYVSTTTNDIADSLSRLQFARFFHLAPQADTQMTTPCTVF